MSHHPADSSVENVQPGLTKNFRQSSCQGLGFKFPITDVSLTPT